MKRASISLLVPLASLSLVVWVLWWEFAGPIHGDIAWSLAIADHLADGRILYHDILEINPPLIFWFAAGARRLATEIGIAPEHSYRILTLIIVIASTFLAASAAREGTLAWVALFILVVMIGRDFGQRDHLVVALLLPMVGRSPPTSQKNLVAIGTLAGIGIALKPHYSVIWALSIISHRHLSIADLFAASVLLAYVALVGWLTPDYFTFLKTFATSYETFNQQSRLDLILQPLALCSLFVAGAAILGRERKYAVASVGAVVVFLMQGKGWTYHAYPMAAFAVLASSLVPRAHWNTVAPLLGGGLVIIFFGGRIAHPEKRVMGYEMDARRDLATVQAGTPMIVVSTLVPDGALRIRERGAVNLAGFPSVWWVRARPSAQAEAMARVQLKNDLRQLPPIIAVESPGISESRVRPGFNLGTYIKEDPVVAEILTQYSADSGDYFVIYRRSVQPGEI